MLFVAMIGEINRRSSDAEQISYFWMHYTKLRTVLKRYNELYPKGRLMALVRFDLAVCLGCFLALAVLFLTFPKA